LVCRQFCSFPATAKQQGNEVQFLFHYNKRGSKLAKPNYQYERRQRDLLKKKRKEEKRQSKLEKSHIPPKVDPEPSSDAE